MIEYIENAKVSTVRLLKTIQVFISKWSLRKGLGCMAFFGWRPQGSSSEVAGRMGQGVRKANIWYVIELAIAVGNCSLIPLMTL